MSSVFLSFPLDRSKPEPLWIQLTGALKSAIAEGKLQPDEALPSEYELIDMFGVSRTVVRAALAELARNGHVYTIRAKGTFVAPRKPDLRFVGTVLGSADDIRANGRRMTTKVLTQELGDASETEAESLNIGAGETVIRLKRLRLVDGIPWLLVDTTLPEALVPGLQRAKLQNRSLYEHLRRHYGIEPVGADRWLQASLPTAEEAGLLQLKEGTPVLKIESVVWDAAETRFEWYQAVHRSDQSRFYVGIR